MVNIGEYPLVNVCIAKITIFKRSTINGPCSIAMFNYQRVKKSLGLVKYGWFDQKTIIRDN